MRDFLIWLRDDVPEFIAVPIVFSFYMFAISCAVYWAALVFLTGSIVLFVAPFLVIFGCTYIAYRKARHNG